MKMSDEQIAKLLSKDISSKTMLINKDELEKVKKEYLDDGWELVNISEVNNRYKITFQKVK